MLTLDQLMELLAAELHPLPDSTLDIDRAFGLRLAQPAIARLDSPPGDIAGFDGYAVRSSESGRRLPVAFSLAAGSRPALLPAASAARVLTGALMPEGADGVVPDELARLTEHGHALTFDPLSPGAGIRRKGEDARAGEIIGAPPQRIEPELAGRIAAAGIDRVLVRPRPRVGLLATGSELQTGPSPWPGSIPASNATLLRALAADARLEITSSAVVPDDLQTLASRLDSLAGTSDLVVTSGGVGAGDADLLPAAVTRLDGRVLTRRIALRPAGVLLVARLGNAWLVGLPGRPAAALVAWRLVVRPLVEALAGGPHACPERPLRAILGTPAANPREHTVVRPATLTAGPVLRVVPIVRDRQPTAASALLRLEPGDALDAGSEVACYPMPWRWM